MLVVEELLAQVEEMLKGGASCPAVAGAGGWQIPRLREDASITPTTRLPHLDLLRGIAILLVLGRHLPVEIAGGSNVLLAIWHRAGWVGVDLFFVLSGFLVGGLLFSEYHKHNQINFGRFLVRRCFRIWPSYTAYLLAAALLLMLEADGPLGRRGIYAFHELRANLLHIQNYAGTRFSHTWSLAVEEHFYLALPLALMVIMRVGPKRGRAMKAIPLLFCAAMLLCLLARLHGSLAAPVFSWRKHMAPTHLHIDSLLGGVCLAYLATFYRRELSRLRPWRTLLLFGGIVCFLPSALLDVETTPFLYSYGLTLLMLGSMALVLWAWIKGQEKAAQPGILLRSVGKIGVYSYSIYLWHAPYCQMFSVPIARAFGMSTPLLLAAYLVIAIVPGIVLYGLIEKPALAMRNKWFPSAEYKSASKTCTSPLRVAA